MGRKLLLLMLLALLIGTVNLVSRVEKAKASGTIYIRADGSIDPLDAPISTVDNVTYTLTGNITSDADGIVVERSNMIVDGAGYKVQGTSDWESYESKGICLDGVGNVTIRNVHVTESYYGVFLITQNTSYSVISGNNMTNNYVGIYLDHSSNNSISENNITNNRYGISLGFSSNYNSISGNKVTANSEGGIGLYYSSSNSISGNNITANNVHGIWLTFSNYNNIYHNNVDNAQQVYSRESANVWDDGYPSGGNYWSDYTGVDLCSSPNQTVTGSDSIGDTPYAIDGSNVDIYPLMAPYSRFEAGTWNETPYDVDFVSNSTISDFHFDSQEGPFLKFSVTGQDGTSGFCRVTIPKGLLWVEDGWTVLYGSYPLSYETFSDENYTYLYFTYTNPSYNGFTTLTINGTHVIPEFPSFLILPTFMVVTLLTVLFYRRKHAT